jgi:hypothetical protein
VRLDADFRTWGRNESSIPEEFCLDLARALDLPKNTIRIIKIERGSVILYTAIQPPHGKYVLDQLLSEPITTGHKTLGKRVYLDRFKMCATKFKSRLFSIEVGDFGLDTAKAAMNPKWNRIYSNGHDDPKGTSWKGSIIRGGKPYFCPKGN